MNINPFPDTVRKIAVLSPAGIPPRGNLEESMTLIRSWGIEVLPGQDLFTRGEEEYFAADREARAEDMNRMISDPEVDLILCSRGGYGSAQILPLLDWDTLRERRLPVLGFSDITALHLGMLASGAGIPVACQMGARLRESSADSFTMNSMRLALGQALFLRERGGTLPAGGKEDVSLLPSSLRRTTVMTPCVRGNAEGWILPANLSILASLCGTPWLPSFRNAVLLLEDIGEKTRILDRHLTQLLLSGILSEVSALIFGDYRNCGTGEELERIIRRTASRISVPVYSGVPFGHSLPSLSFLCGARVRIEDDVLCF